MADYTDKKVPHLIINNMSQEKFDELKAAGELDPTQVYLTPTEETGGGISLPDQTDNAGKFLTTDGADVSWSDKPLVNNIPPDGWSTALAIGKEASVSSVSSLGIAIGGSANSGGNCSIAIGGKAKTSANISMAIGYNAQANASGAIQLGSIGLSKAQNNDANTFKVANNNGNFEMMDSSGNVPLERLTYVTDQIGDISTALTAILGE